MILNYRKIPKTNEHNIVSVGVSDAKEGSGKVIQFEASTRTLQELKAKIVQMPTMKTMYMLYIKICFSHSPLLH